MSTPILPGYEHQIINGAGLSVTAGRPKVVWHTTETGGGSLQVLISSWARNWGSGLPHFIVEGSRVVQLLPINVGGYTLENRAGGADTNRSGPAVQAEVVSRAANDWDDATYEAVGKLLADVKRAGHDIDLGWHPRWYGANEGIVLATVGSPVRMSAADYVAFGGWCAHQHVPENAHWDCGAKDTDRIERIARAHFDGSTPTPPPVTPPTTKEEDDEMLKAPRTAWVTKKGGAWYALTPDGKFRYIDGGAPALAGLRTGHEGWPPEISEPIPIDDGAVQFLERFYNGAP